MINIETMSILIVDDMKSMRLTIRQMLKNLGIAKTLKFADNGKTGLEILAHSKFDLAIVDWNMPVMNGVEMLERIRASKRLRDMPVIMVTAESERDIVAEVAEIEVNAYLLKPLTLASLDEKIRSVVEKVNNPEPATLHRLKARDFEEEGDYESAIEQIRIALSYRPNASRLLRQMGLLHFKIGKEKIGEKCLLKAASVNKQDILTRVYLAEYYIGKKKLESAGRYFFEILTLSSRHNDRAIELGEKLLIKGSRRLALNIFSRAITLSKKQNTHREKVIDICLAHEELEYPLMLMDQSIKENPSNYDIVYKAGLVHLEAGNIKQALNYFIEVDRHVRGHIDAKLQIAAIYYRAKKVLKADDYLRQILRIDPENKKALALRRAL